MTLLPDKFHIYLIFVCLLTIITISCEKTEQPPIEQKTFIEVYARLSIINSLRAEKDFYDRLIAELLTNYKTDMPTIDKAVNFYNNQPEKWVGILDQVRDRISELKNERLQKNAQPATAEPQRKKSFKRPRRKTPAEKNRE